MFKYIISYDGGQLRDSSDFEWGLFDSYDEAEKLHHEEYPRRRIIDRNEKK